METWPFYLRSGYLLMEVIVPLGVLLLLVLQGRNLFRSLYKIHFGYLYWALFLVSVSFIGFSGLQAQERPSAVPFSRIASFGLVETEPALQPEEPAAAIAEKADTGSVAAVDTEPDTSADTPAKISSDTAAVPALSTETSASTAPESTTEKITSETKTLVQEPDPAIEVNNQRILALEEKIKLLEAEIVSLKEVATSQKELIRSLRLIFGDRLKEQVPPPVQQEPVTMEKTETPTVSNNEPLKPKPVEEQSEEPVSPEESDESN